MSKSYRIRTKVGEDSFVKVNLQQDFDILEILSLKLTQSDVFSRMCADYGVIVGRVVANSGLGVPNAKLSIFIPLTAKDEQDPLIKEMYPFKKVTDKNEAGYKYNLLPATKQHNRHTPTGSFFNPQETISNPIKLEVYEKYYKFSVKTNENGDYMIWGVPLGIHQIHMSVDVSDIGCYSMKPFDFISQGVSEEKFKTSAIFDESENLDTLPQIVIQNKTVESVSFWGDDEMCNSGISRVDFDLRDSNVEFRPNALFMGSILSDDNSGSLGWKCAPGKNQGDVCKLTTGSGKIEAIRFTVFEADDEVNPNCSCRPKLEKISIHNIDASGSFVAKVPMNLDYIYTDEFGLKQISANPAIGVPTRGKYRFRISFDNEYGSESRKGRYLVPNIREYSNQISASYQFSTDLLDYPHDLGSTTQIKCDNYLTSPAFLGEDYFYEMFPDNVYTLSQFIDIYRNDYLNTPFDNGSASANLPNRGSIQAGYGAKRDRWSFIGIKSTNPAKETDCSGTVTEFPPVDGFRGGSWIFLMTQLQLFLTMISIFVPFMVMTVTILYDLKGSLLSLMSLLTTYMATVQTIYDIVVGFGYLLTLGTYFNIAMYLIMMTLYIVLEIAMALLIVGAMTSLKYTLALTKFDECEDCNCGNFFKLDMPSLFGVGNINEITGDTVVDDPNCQIPALVDGNMLYYSEIHMEDYDVEGEAHTSVSGCYTVSFDGSGFEETYTATMWTMVGMAAAMAWIPALGSTLASSLANIVIMGFIIAMAFFLLIRLAVIFFALNEWRVRKNIYNGLCQGVFNLGFWNSWIRGTLYHFRFDNKKTTATDPILLTDTVTDYFCRDTIIGPDEITSVGLVPPPNAYYYRSCPWDPMIGAFTPDSQVYNFSYLSSLTTTTETIAYRQYYKGINYPTTILQLGTFEDLSKNNVCLDCDAAENYDYYMDKLGASTHKSPAGILDYFINQKLMRYDFWEIQFAGINNWFGGTRSFSVNSFPATGGAPDKNVRQLKANGGNPSGGQHRLLDGDIAQAVAFNSELGIYKYQSPFYYTDDPNYGPLPSTIIDPDINVTFARKEFIISEISLRSSIMGGPTGYPSSQVIPYYPWIKDGAIYGTRDNNWGVSDNSNITIVSNQAQPGPIITPPTGPINDIASDAQISTGFYHYYFGLYQGNNAYDKFVSGYQSESE